jgi:hypothetical protein
MIAHGQFSPPAHSSPAGRRRASVLSSAAPALRAPSLPPHSQKRSRGKSACSWRPPRLTLRKRDPPPRALLRVGEVRRGPAWQVLRATGPQDARCSSCSIRELSSRPRPDLAATRDLRHATRDLRPARDAPAGSAIADPTTSPWSSRRRR